MKAILVGLLMACFTFASNAQSNNETRIPPNQISLVAEDSWYPFSGVPDGVPSGRALDIITAAYKAVGVVAVFEVLPFVRGMELVKAGGF